ncbi:hypothetical protein TSOC_014764 [Tetrabaena socialis]|uniref:Uncharacterized protein n=1 Tax=Tetrabaena socialis TaxID=47790 RepID=A0A2J7ZGS9_9CHLO|nr:hypothetical protein TSOC_014764 [Tetrabaena socialis]|eukprot:PNG99457.1 hypothetical protein TSOC_014764 [Tetrabaena socialis]
MAPGKFLKPQRTTPEPRLERLDPSMSFNVQLIESLLRSDQHRDAFLAVYRQCRSERSVPMALFGTIVRTLDTIDACRQEVTDLLVSYPKDTWMCMDILPKYLPDVHHRFRAIQEELIVFMSKHAAAFAKPHWGCGGYANFGDDTYYDGPLGDSLSQLFDVQPPIRSNTWNTDLKHEFMLDYADATVILLSKVVARVTPRDSSFAEALDLTEIWGVASMLVDTANDEVVEPAVLEVDVNKVLEVDVNKVLALAATFKADTAVLDEDVELAATFKAVLEAETAVLDVDVKEDRFKAELDAASALLGAELEAESALMGAELEAVSALLEAETARFEAESLSHEV